MAQIIFKEFEKIARLTRRVSITEKINGANCQVIITDDGQIGAGSREGLVRPEANGGCFGFAQWVIDNREQLLTLGPGNHFGEWWGAGVRKGYGKQPKTFSLFNIARWTPTIHWTPSDPLELFPKSRPAPSCCSVVPLLWVGPFDTEIVDLQLANLASRGSAACPGAIAEGLIVFHEAANVYFKKTIKDDSSPKGAIV